MNGLTHSDLQTFRTALAAIKALECPRCLTPGPLCSETVVLLYAGHLDVVTSKMRDVLLITATERGWGLVGRDADQDIVAACPACATPQEVADAQHELAVWRTLWEHAGYRFHAQN